ncbi:MAG TPA: hypothetical protein VMZ91_01525 [Candidatus Paceibacterota bacterium]|nr:hypothetical protein [Candidatus Paceibacterota bacterium]
MSKELPIYKIKGKFYYRDERLGEYRNIKNVSDTIPINSYPELETPTMKDKDKVWKRGLKK